MTNIRVIAAKPVSRDLRIKDHEYQILYLNRKIRTHSLLLYLFNKQILWINKKFIKNKLYDNIFNDIFLYLNYNVYKMCIKCV